MREEQMKALFRFHQLGYSILLAYGIFGNGVALGGFAPGRRSLGSRRLEPVLSVYGISENAIGKAAARS
jgi:hypothetical protein